MHTKAQRWGRSRVCAAVNITQEHDYIFMLTTQTSLWSCKIRSYPKASDQSSQIAAIPEQLPQRVGLLRCEEVIRETGGRRGEKHCWQRIGARNGLVTVTASASATQQEPICGEHNLCAEGLGYVLFTRANRKLPDGTTS